MVTSRLEHYPADTDGPATLIYVDPGFIGNWRNEPWHGDLLKRLDLGERIFTVENGQYQELLVKEPDMSRAEQPHDTPLADEREQRRLEFSHRIEIERAAARKKPGSELKIDALAAKAAALISTRKGRK